jgi:hypothetical protein
MVTGGKNGGMANTYNVSANYGRELGEDRGQKSAKKSSEGRAWRTKDFEILSNLITVIMLLFFPL